MGPSLLCRPHGNKCNKVITIYIKIHFLFTLWFFKLYHNKSLPVCITVRNHVKHLALNELSHQPTTKELHCSLTRLGHTSEESLEAHRTNFIITTFTPITTEGWASSHHLALINVQWFEEGWLWQEQALQGTVILPQALHK